MPYRDTEKRREMNRRRYALRVDGTLPPSRPALARGIEHGEPTWMPELGRMGLRAADGLVVDVGFGVQELPDQQGRV